MFKNIRSYLLPIVAVLAVGGVGVWFVMQPEPQEIVAYNAQRDRTFIETLFQKDWYWLTTQQFDPELYERWLEHRSPTGDPASFGTLIIQMAQVDGTDTGFIAYYMKSVYEGQILFIAVQPNYRNRHIGRSLLKFALKDLKARGVTIVRLITRPSNETGRKLYERVGFIPYLQTPEHVYYEMKLTK